MSDQGWPPCVTGHRHAMTGTSNGRRTLWGPCWNCGRSWTDTAGGSVMPQPDLTQVIADHLVQEFTAWEDCGASDRGPLWAQTAPGQHTNCAAVAGEIIAELREAGYEIIRRATEEDTP